MRLFEPSCPGGGAGGGGSSLRREGGEVCFTFRPFRHHLDQIKSKFDLLNVFYIVSNILFDLQFHEGFHQCLAFNFLISD